MLKCQTIAMTQHRESLAMIFTHLQKPLHYNAVTIPGCMLAAKGGGPGGGAPPTACGPGVPAFGGMAIEGGIDGGIDPGGGTGGNAPGGGRPAQTRCILSLFHIPL